MCYRRKGKLPKDDILIIFNMPPVVRRDWKVYAKGKSKWKEMFNSDDKKYWGTGAVFNPSVTTTLVDKTNKTFEINVHLPALGALMLK